MIGWIDKAIDYFSEKPEPSVIPASLFADGEAPGLPDESLPFDLMLTESHSLDFEITEHGIEAGAAVADMIRERLRRVTVTGMFTNHPVGTAGTYVGEDGKKKEKSPDKVKIDGRTPVTNTALERWEKLKKVAKARKTVKLVTAMETYGEMAVEKLSASRSGRDGESVTFQMTLREIRTAKLAASKITGTKYDPAEPSSMEKDSQKALSKVQENGPQSATEADAAEISNRLAKAVGGTTSGG